MEYDLSGKICASLDKHLALAILEFLSSRSGATSDDFLGAKLALVEKTYMCDYAADLYCEAHHTKDVRFSSSNSSRRARVCTVRQSYGSLVGSNAFILPVVWDWTRW